MKQDEAHRYTQAASPMHVTAAQRIARGWRAYVIVGTVAYPDPAEAYSRPTRLPVTRWIASGS